MENNENQEKEKILKEENHTYSNKKEGEMARKKNGGMKLLKIAGGVLLIIGGISTFSKFIVESNVIGVLISAVAFFVGLWLIGQTIE